MMSYTDLLLNISRDRIDRLLEFATEGHENYGRECYQPTKTEIKELAELAKTYLEALDDYGIDGEWRD
jgi:hypothetical protein